MLCSSQLSSFFTLNQGLQHTHPAFIHASYEIVVLRPDEFRKTIGSLLVYDTPEAQTHKKYVLASDNDGLREFPGTPECPRLPRNTPPRRHYAQKRNPWLIVLDAARKFRHCLHDGESIAAFGEHTGKLIKATLSLRDEICWRPEWYQEMQRFEALEADPIDASDESSEDEVEEIKSEKTNQGPQRQVRDSGRKSDEAAGNQDSVWVQREEGMRILGGGPIGTFHEL